MSICKFAALSAATILLAGCSGSSGGGNGGGGTGGETVSVLFGLADETEIALDQKGTRFRQVAGTGPNAEGGPALVADYSASTLSKKAKDVNLSVFRYATGAGAPADNVRILALVDGSVDGVAVKTGSGTDDDVRQGKVDTRSFTVTEVQQDQSVFGILLVNEERTEYGTFENTHAFAGGVAAGALPGAVANYSGSFLGYLVLNDGSSSAEGGTFALTSDFGAAINQVSGVITLDGTVANSLDLAGSLAGSGFSGTAIVVSDGGDSLSNGASGSASGQFFGATGEEVAGTLQIIDTGAVLTGAFGGN